MPIFPVRGKQRQENSYKYEANLNYIVSLGHSESKTNKQTNKRLPPGVETVPRVGKRTGMQTHNIIVEGVLSSSKGIKLIE